MATKKQKPAEQKKKLIRKGTWKIEIEFYEDGTMQMTRENTNLLLFEMFGILEQVKFDLTTHYLDKETVTWVNRGPKKGEFNSRGVTKYNPKNNE